MSPSRQIYYILLTSSPPLSSFSQASDTQAGALLVGARPICNMRSCLGMAARRSPSL